MNRRTSGNQISTHCSSAPRPSFTSLMLNPFALLAILSCLLISTSSFTLHPTSSFASFISTKTTTSASTSLFGGAQGISTSPLGKATRVASIKALLTSSSLIISLPSETLTVPQSSTLRKLILPTNSTATLIKNTLMVRALNSTPASLQTYGSLIENLNGTNLWIFVPSDNHGETITLIKSFLKDANILETNAMKYGVIEGTFCTPVMLNYIQTLPKKKELLSKLATGLKSLPTRLARVLKSPGLKVTMGIKLGVGKGAGS